MPVDLIADVQRSSSTFCNGNYALLGGWKVPCHILEFGMLNYFCCCQWRPVILGLACWINRERVAYIIVADGSQGDYEAVTYDVGSIAVTTVNTGPQG